MSGEVSHHAGITSLSMLTSRIVVIRMDCGVAAGICTEAIHNNDHSPLYAGKYSGGMRREIIPCCRVLTENLTVPQKVNKFPAFYGIRRFITVLTRAVHWTYSEPDDSSLEPFLCDPFLYYPPISPESPK
jgi:hypothetical protein